MGYNKLVGRYDGADGMKTGFVCPSGFNLIGSATRNGSTLTAVVLGEGSAVKRTEMVAMLLDYGFGTTGGQTVTLGTLRAYGTPDAPPSDHARGDLPEEEEAGVGEVRGRRRRHQGVTYVLPSPSRGSPRSPTRCWSRWALAMRPDPCR